MIDLEIRETWLRPHVDFLIPVYCSVRSDRTAGQGGGCATFIKEGLAHCSISVPPEYKCDG